jgi:hypothetical protein
LKEYIVKYLLGLLKTNGLGIKWSFILKKLSVLLGVIFYPLVHAHCVIYQNDTPLSSLHQDAVSLLLNEEGHCPQSIQDLQRQMQAHGLQSNTAMVANRGKNNPSEGSFSFFSSIQGQLRSGFQIHPGDFFLGHFTTLEGNDLTLDQEPSKKKLLIELIAWDQQEQHFNFYELRGLDEQRTRWFYRGNSRDALLDNTYLNRQAPKSEPKFGSRMRCSACHASGGPIIKEMTLPHNDWWTRSNTLDFTPNHPDAEVAETVAYLIDADQFSSEVQTGIKKLNHSVPFKEFKQTLSLQEQLRPLFCTDEINLESNLTPGLMLPVAIPSGFWLNPLLGKVESSVSAPEYQHLLTNNRMHFPETDLSDADHSWLTPVKGRSDLQAIKQLIQSEMITQEFAESVLMIDYTHPVFSKPRCDLLQWVPEKDGRDWVSRFMTNLNQKAVSPEAKLLATYLSNQDVYNSNYFQEIITNYQRDIKQRISTSEGLQQAFLNLIQLRSEVFENELSQNPLGQILEPGFRVIFPEALNLP